VLEEGKKYSVTPTRNGDSDYFLISEALKKHIGMKDGDDIEFMMDSSKKGKFISFWPKRK
jgi:hypothetical protein